MARAETVCPADEGFHGGFLLSRADEKALPGPAIIYYTILPRDFNPGDRIAFAGPRSGKKMKYPLYVREDS
jgi:hypothetical protein